jgi:hypothetical protein
MVCHSKILIEGNTSIRDCLEFFDDAPDVGAEIARKLKSEFKDQELYFREKVSSILFTNEPAMMYKLSVGYQP